MPPAANNMNNGMRGGTEAVARSSKAIESKSKCTVYLHCLFHLMLIAAALGVIYWGLILGRVFLPVEKDYLNNPKLPLLRPPDEPAPEEKAE